jgi:hypothetical protein
MNESYVSRGRCHETGVVRLFRFDLSFSLTQLQIQFLRFDTTTRDFYSLQATDSQ